MGKTFFPTEVKYLLSMSTQDHQQVTDSLSISIQRQFHLEENKFP